MEHQQKSGYGASATAEGVDDIDQETAEDLKKRKRLEAQAIERKGAAEKKKKAASEAAKEADARQFDIVDEPVTPAPLKPSLLLGSKIGSLSHFSSPLTKVLEVGKEIVIQNIPSPIIDYLVDRGLIGPGSLMNSSQYTEIPANCILIHIPWHEDEYSLSNFLVPTKPEKMRAVLVAKFDIDPNTNR